MLMPMKTCLSHSTALEFWRHWSISHSITLEQFHQIRRMSSSLLPVGSYRFASALGPCLTREADIRGLVNAVGSNPPGIESSDQECLRLIASTTAPIEVLVGSNRGAKSSRGVVRNYAAAHFPKQSFARIDQDLYVCSPELVFLQMARRLPFGGLLALGYELCGCYPAPSPSGAPLVRRPLTSPARLSAFVNRAAHCKGAKIARIASRQIQAKSASPMETELAIIAFTAVSRGGLGLTPARLNEPVALSQQAAKATGLHRVVCDFLWADRCCAIEYDGHDAHKERHRQAHDSRKRDALSIDGIDLITITSSQFHHIDQCTALLDSIARRLGKPKRKRRVEHLAAHLDLRRQVRAFHQNAPRC